MQAAIAAQPLNATQRQARFAAMEAADYASRRFGLPVSEEEFSRIFASELHRRMMEELQPIHRAMARVSMFDARPRLCIVDGVAQPIELEPLPELAALQALADAVVARYCEGVRR